MHSIAHKPTYVTLPAKQAGIESILDYLSFRFTKVPREVWEMRIKAGKICCDDGSTVDINTEYRCGMRIGYYREVENELVIPFEEEIIFRNDHIIVACKPHFLPVHPAGAYLNECLVYRLRKKFDNPDIVPVNRLDRETAGLVLMSVNPETRAKYYALFQKRKVTKLYHAIGDLPADRTNREWLVESRIEQSQPWFIYKNVEGKVNAKSHIKLIDEHEDKGFFEMKPVTGKSHQLRLHMLLIGSRIVNDWLYPVLENERKASFDRPLQLLAKELSFLDPVSGKEMFFSSRKKLNW